MCITFSFPLFSSKGSLSEAVAFQLYFTGQVFISIFRVFEILFRVSPELPAKNVFACYLLITFEQSTVADCKESIWEDSCQI